MIDTDDLQNDKKAVSSRRLHDTDSDAIINTYGAEKSYYL